MASFSVDLESEDHYCYNLPALHHTVGIIPPDFLRGILQQPNDNDVGEVTFFRLIDAENGNSRWISARSLPFTNILLHPATPIEAYQSANTTRQGLGLPPLPNPQDNADIEMLDPALRGNHRQEVFPVYTGPWVDDLLGSLPQSHHQAFEDSLDGSDANEYLFHRLIDKRDGSSRWCSSRSVGNCGVALHPNNTPFSLDVDDYPVYTLWALPQDQGIIPPKWLEEIKENLQVRDRTQIWFFRLEDNEMGNSRWCARRSVGMVGIDLHPNSGVDEPFENYYNFDDHAWEAGQESHPDEKYPEEMEDEAEEELNHFLNFQQHHSPAHPPVLQPQQGYPPAYPPQQGYPPAYPPQQGYAPVYAPQQAYAPAYPQQGFYQPQGYQGAFGPVQTPAPPAPAPAPAPGVIRRRPNTNEPFTLKWTNKMRHYVHLLFDDRWSGPNSDLNTNQRSQVFHHIFRDAILDSGFPNGFLPRKIQNFSAQRYRSDGKKPKYWEAMMAPAHPQDAAEIAKRASYSAHIAQVRREIFG